MNKVLDRYINEVDKVVKSRPNLEMRYLIINKICEMYYQEIGEQLPSYILNELGTWYIQEIYSDKRTNKVAIEEFPILTEYQLLRRQRKIIQVKNEYVLETLNYHLMNNSSISKKDADFKSSNTA